MRIRHETPESRAYQMDVQNLRKHQDKAWEMFQKLLSRTERLAQEARELFPESVDLQKRSFVQNLPKFGPAFRFLNTYVGAEQHSPKAKSWRRRTLYQLRNLHFDPDYPLSEAERVIRQVAFQGFQAIELYKGQKPLEVLPGEVKALLPKNIVVKVDEDGHITKMTDRFSNAHENLAKKIDKMRELAVRYNGIVKKVKKDLKSSDELTRLSALITSIIMETGIRPGKIGQGFTKLVDGEELSIDTFGAITLGPTHVRFIRDNFAELDFPGKKGTVNIALLTDPQVIGLLKTYVDKALTSQVPFVFITEKGEQYGYKHFQRYFRTQVFSGIAPSDFRKLKATQAVLDHLNTEQEALYERVRAFSETEIDNLKERVTEEVVKVVQDAYVKATQALSHEEAKTTIEQYINPEVVLRFLSQGKIEKDLRRAILEQKNQLSFNPEVFIERARAKTGSLSIDEFYCALLKES